MALPDAGDIARMRRIIDRLRSYGVEVREMPGWEKRGFQYPAVPVKVFDHHDASSRKSGEWGALGLILDGTPRGIPGPLSNFQVARCLDGKPKVAIVAAGYTYHAGTGGPRDGLPLNNANPRTYGTEKANDGLGEPYTAAANYATNALFHAVAVESGGSPGTFPMGHKEWTSRKSDPAYSMIERRRQVGAFVPPAPSTSEEDAADMSYLKWTPEDREALLADINRNVWNRSAEGSNSPWPIHMLIGVDNKTGTSDYMLSQLSTKGLPASAVPAAAPAVNIDAAALAAALAGNADFRAALTTGLADELDRRARDGDPKTGPAS